MPAGPVYGTPKPPKRPTTTTYPAGATSDLNRLIDRGLSLTTSSRPLSPAQLAANRAATTGSFNRTGPNAATQRPFGDDLQGQSNFLMATGDAYGQADASHQSDLQNYLQWLDQNEQQGNLDALFGAQKGGSAGGGGGGGSGGGGGGGGGGIDVASILGDPSLYAQLSPELLQLVSRSVPQFTPQDITAVAKPFDIAIDNTKGYRDLAGKSIAETDQQARDRLAHLRADYTGATAAYAPQQAQLSDRSSILNDLAAQGASTKDVLAQMSGTQSRLDEQTAASKALYDRFNQIQNDSFANSEANLGQIKSGADAQLQTNAQQLVQQLLGTKGQAVSDATKANAEGKAKADAAQAQALFQALWDQEQQRAQFAQQIALKGGGGGGGGGGSRGGGGGGSAGKPMFTTPELIDFLKYQGTPTETTETTGNPGDPNAQAWINAQLSIPGFDPSKLSAADAKNFMDIAAQARGTQQTVSKPNPTAIGNQYALGALASYVNPQQAAAQEWSARQRAAALSQLR
jgi:hypothetical protein